MGRIIEVSGAKFEIDDRDIRNIEQYKVGDKVKLLKKEYNSYKAVPGIIVGIDNFPSLPTIVIAYVENSYNVEVRFAYINAETKDCEISPMINDELNFTKASVMDMFKSAIASKKLEITDLETKRDYFLKCFKMYFTDVEE